MVGLKRYQPVGAAFSDYSFNRTMVGLKPEKNELSTSYPQF